MIDLSKYINFCYAIVRAKEVLAEREWSADIDANRVTLTHADGEVMTTEFHNVGGNVHIDNLNSVGYELILEAIVIANQ